jgi:hypothetical protein
VFVGYSRIKGEYWAVGARTVQCFNCHRFGHFRAVCRSATRCAKCGGEHDVKLCVSRSVSCPNCSMAHFAWNDSCSVAVEARRRASAQLGFSPRVVGSVSRSSVSRVGSSFAAVAGGVSGSAPPVSSFSGAVNDQSLMARDLARYVVSFLSETFGKVIDALLAALRPQPASDLPSAAPSPSGSAPLGIPDDGDPFTRFLSALQSVFSSIDARSSSVAALSPNG